jgi:glycosyltransferase involved in cell wall biosynthesis
MRVAIIAEVYLPKIDGVVIRTMNLIRELQAAGDSVEVFCPEAAGVEQSPVPVTSFPSFSFPLYPEYRVGRPTTVLLEQLEQFRPDVVHFLNPFAFGFQCHDLLCRAGWSAPTLFSFHTLYAEYVRRYRALTPLARMLWWMTREYHNRADQNLTVSAMTRDSLTRAGFQRVDLWRPAVDSTLYSPEKQNRRMRSFLAGGHNRKYQLLTVSRLAPEKNVEFLADVLRQVPEASLAIVGDGPHRAALERRFSGLPVMFAGYLKGIDLATAYASCDAFVYGSETETMGNVVLEAMSSGLPVVAPRAGGIPSIVTHEQNGLLFSAGDVASASELTRSVMRSDGLGRRLSASAREFACDHGWKQSAEHVRRSYRNAVAQYHSRATAPAAVSFPARLSTKVLVNFFRLASRASLRGNETSTSPLPVCTFSDCAVHHEPDLEVATPDSLRRSTLEVSTGV